MPRLKIELNNTQNIRDLLQEAYRLAEEQIVQVQNEINKLANATNLQDEPMDAKAKYAKSINDYLGMKDKAIAKKLEISKILTDILHHSGDNKGQGDMMATTPMSFNFDDIKKMVDDSYKDKEKINVINLDKKN